MQNRDSLSQRLENIKRIFNIANVLSVSGSKEYIQKYYKINKIPYSIFHAKNDFVHLGISRDGVYKTGDLLEMAKTVEKYISNSEGSKILELAVGRGANSFYLAKKFPNTKFYGIDISKTQLDYAYKKARQVDNFYPNFGDYHDLSEFEDETFDVVFVIEALCYSTNKPAVLSEVRRVLKKGGIFIVMDGYSNKELMTEDEKVALNLVVKGMALEKSELYKTFIEYAKENKFKIEFEEDISEFVLPTLEQFERKATKFFKLPKLAKIASKILPKEFLYNAITGYLFATLQKIGISIYMITVLRKTEVS